MVNDSLVKLNYAKYKTHLPFLSVAIRVAGLVKENDLAVKYALRQLLVAKKPIEIAQAVNAFVRLIIKNEQVDARVKEFSSKKNLSHVEQFLLADLYSHIGEQEKANDLLSQLAKSKEPVNVLLLARIYERRSELRKAAEMMEELIKLPKQLKPSYLRRLVAYTSVQERQI